MEIRYKSMVSVTPAAESADANAFFQRKLGYETDCSDVYNDMKHDTDEFVLIDTRNPEAYERSHVPRAINIPTAQLTEKRLEAYPAETLFVVYCWGPGCNGATKAAIKLSAMGRPVKEMIGGIEYWEDRERYPTERGGL